MNCYKIYTSFKGRLALKRIPILFETPKNFSEFSDLIINIIDKQIWENQLLLIRYYLSKYQLAVTSSSIIVTIKLLIKSYLFAIISHNYEQGNSEILLFGRISITFASDFHFCIFLDFMLPQ